jgi:tetratricopeptide (TPR) repeat protein
VPPKFSLPIVWDYVERGQAYQALGNSKAAIVDFDQALTFKTDDYYYERGYVYNQRALAKQSLGQKQAALQDFKKAAEEYGSGEEYEQIMKSIKELQ